MVWFVLQDFQPPKGMLKASIEENFGSVDDMVREMIQKGTGVQVCDLTMSRSRLA